MRTGLIFGCKRGEPSYMKPVLKDILRFLLKEWFLWVMLMAIALVVLLFEALGA